MKIHRRLIVLVGLGMLLIMSITVLSLLNITAEFTASMRRMGQISLEVKRIWTIEQRIGDATRAVRRYVETGDSRFKANYASFHDEIKRELDETRSLTLVDRELVLITALINDFRTMEEQAERIFSLPLNSSRDRAAAKPILADLDNLVIWTQHDIERYREDNATKLDEVASELGGTKVRISFLFGLILVTMVGLLFALGIYLYRKVSLPLSQLWAGTGEISRGNLDYQVQVRGENDIVHLAERFNEMSQKLKVSYAALEDRLLDRTKQLTALNSVSLTLGQGGSLREVLQRSLTTVLQSFADMAPRGGIFLCEPDGETLHLVAHVGLPRDFAVKEERIRMGECLCGIAAQTGEVIYTEQGCSDPRHTRQAWSVAGAHIVVPIKSRGIVLGVMFLYPARQFSLKQSDLQLFDTIGAGLGMAVENLRLYGEVKQSSHRYWDLFEKSRDILFTMDMEGRLTSANEAMEHFTGRPKSGIIGANIVDFLADDGKALIRRILIGEEPLADRIHEIEMTRPNGERAFLEISGRSLFQLNKPLGFQIAARDVTEQKILRELVVQAERLAAIGQIMVTVRHEVNNPLTTVIGNIELLIDRYGQGDGDLKRRLETVLDNSLRISEIIKRLQEIKEVKTVDYVKGVKMTDPGSR
ncbi:MAG: PAS domain S-box protein [Nitrospirota bacterium]|nr:PAS domain S-box protein [Nitrospirota bacterium]